jgi:mycothiol system anti-sigma-R factor
MSCGNHHDVPCSEVLAEVFLFLDSECDEPRRHLIAEHLEECGPCLAQFGIEAQMKELVARKCGGDRAPDGLKQRVLLHLRTVVVVEAEADSR